MAFNLSAFIPAKKKKRFSLVQLEAIEQTTILWGLAEILTDLVKDQLFIDKHPSF